MLSISRQEIQSNLFAGITVGIIALPLSMALAIASGVPPQHGLYTAIIAGIVSSLAGGSKHNISGPTAAFVVILLPIVQLYGFGGLLMSGLMAGILLVLMGIGKVGRFISMVPYPVIIGFTSGIGVVIATIQVKDFFGLTVESLDGHYIDKVLTLIQSLPSFRIEELVISSLTLAILIVWPKFKSRIPPHLVALLLASVSAWALGQFSPDISVATIGSRFEYVIDGVTGHGIPPVAPQFNWPWELPDAQGQPIGLSFGLVNTLLSSAFAIAILGALESLLCAVVADGMAGTKHDPNKELLGQGFSNILAPFFGGIPSTAAIARTAANIRSGGTTALSPVVHALTILASMLLLADLIAYIPMAAMSALLLKVAWNMSEAKHFIRIIREAPRSDVATLLTCFLLTVIFDMEIAVATGIGLASLLFIKRSIDLMDSSLVEPHEHPHAENLPDSAMIYDINGPMFFGAAQKALGVLTNIRINTRFVILDMSDVTMIDMTAIIAMESIINDLRKKEIMIVINNLDPKMILKLRKAGLRQIDQQIHFARDMVESTRIIEEVLDQQGTLAT